MSILRNTPITLSPRSLALCSLAFVATAEATPSTPGGAISVAQVAEMLDQAPSNRMAQQVLTAYLGGVGEAAGVLVGLGGAACHRPLSLSAEEARHAIAPASAGGQASTLAATPLIVRDMLARAGCRRG